MLHALSSIFTHVRVWLQSQRLFMAEFFDGRLPTSTTERRRDDL